MTITHCLLRQQFMQYLKIYLFSEKKVLSEFINRPSMHESHITYVGQKTEATIIINIKYLKQIKLKRLTSHTKILIIF